MTRIPGHLALTSFTMLAASGIVLFLNVATALVVARVLGPEEFALWGVVALIGGYSVWAQMGAFNGMNREVPRLAGQDQAEDVPAIQGGALAVGCVTALVMAAVLVATGLAMRAVGSPMWSAVVISAPFVVVRQAWVYLGTVYRAHQDFTFVAEFQVISALTSTAVGIPLVLLYGFEGFVFGQIIAYVATCIYAVRRRRYALMVIRPSREQIHSLILVGFPIWLAGLMNELASSVDRIVGLVLLSPAAYGIYSLTPFVRQAAGLPARSLAEVVYPRLSHKVGEGGSAHELRSLLTRQDVALAFTMPVVLGLVYVSLPTLVHLALPEYAPGVEMLGFYSLALSWWALFASGNGLNALGYGQGYARILAFTGAISAVSALLLILVVPAALALPLGVGAAGMIGSALTMQASQRAVGASGIEAIFHVVSVSVPIILLSAAAVVVGWAFKGADPIQYALRVVTFCIAVFPVLWFGEWRFAAVRMIVSSVRRSVST